MSSFSCRLLHKWFSSVDTAPDRWVETYSLFSISSVQVPGLSLTGTFFVRASVPYQPVSHSRSKSTGGSTPSLGVEEGTVVSFPWFRLVNTLEFYD